MRYVNTDANERVWPALRHPDGHTLGLQAGETVDLDQVVDDPYLRPVEISRRARRRPQDDTQPSDSTDRDAGDGDTSAPPADEPAAADASGKEA